MALTKPSDAIYAFAAYLTMRDEPITVSSNHGASEMARITADFLDANDLPPPGDEYSWVEPEGTISGFDEKRP